MIRFQAEKYLEIVRDLTEADYKFRDLYKGEPTDEPLIKENREIVLGVIRDVQKLAEEIKLPVLYEYLNTAQQRISWEYSTPNDAIYYNRGMRDVLLADVKAHTFIQIAPDKKEMYLNAVNNTVDLVSAYPKVKHDLMEAHLCFAFERYSACVHHLMIAVEVAMRIWAKRYKLQTARPVSLEDWDKILRAADKKLEELMNKPRSFHNDTKQKHLAQTAMHFGFIKDGYRKHSAHGRTHFDESSAKTVMSHINEFMRLLAPKRRFAPTLSGLFGLGASGLVPSLRASEILTKP